MTQVNRVSDQPPTVPVLRSHGAQSDGDRRESPLFDTILHHEASRHSTPSSKLAVVTAQAPRDQSDEPHTTDDHGSSPESTSEGESDDDEVTSDQERQSDNAQTTQTSVESALGQAAVAAYTGIHALNFTLLRGGATAAAEHKLVTRVQNQGTNQHRKASTNLAVSRELSAGRGGDTGEPTSPQPEISADKQHARSILIDVDRGGPRHPPTEHRSHHSALDASTPHTTASSLREEAQHQSYSAQMTPERSGVASGAAALAADALRRLSTLGSRINSATDADHSGPKVNSTSSTVHAVGTKADGGHHHAVIARQRTTSEHSTPSPAKQVSIQLLRSVQTALQRAGASSGIQPATDTALISLRPQSLGQVNIRVEVRDGAVSASFESRTDVAHDLLRSSITMLREDLEARGLTVQRLDVTRSDDFVRVSGESEPTQSRRLPDAEQKDAGDAAPPQGRDSEQLVGDESGHGGGEEKPKMARGHRGGVIDEDQDAQPVEPADTMQPDQLAWMPISGLVDRVA